MPSEADFEWERNVLERAQTAAANLIDAAVELRWYSDEPLGAAMGHVESVLRARGQTPIEERPDRKPRRRRPLPFRAVWDRDGWRCLTCGSHENLTVDHTVPFSKGGSDDIDNLQTLCGSCNSSKGAR